VFAKHIEKIELPIKFKMRNIFTYLMYVSTAVLLFFSIWCNNGAYSTLFNSDSRYAPMEAVDYLDTYDKDDVVLYTEFNNGAYCEFRGYRVYIDGRPELFSKKLNGKDDVLDEYCQITNGKADIGEFIQKYNFTHLIVSDKSIVSGYLKGNDAYIIVVEGKEYCLFEKKGFRTK
jgi:hypothetical protein